MIPEYGRVFLSKTLRNVPAFAQAYAQANEKAGMFKSQKWHIRASPKRTEYALGIYWGQMWQLVEYMATCRMHPNLCQIWKFSRCQIWQLLEYVLVCAKFGGKKKMPNMATCRKCPSLCQFWRCQMWQLV